MHERKVHEGGKDMILGGRGEGGVHDRRKRESHDSWVERKRVKCMRGEWEIYDSLGGEGGERESHDSWGERERE